MPPGRKLPRSRGRRPARLVEMPSRSKLRSNLLLSVCVALVFGSSIRTKMKLFGVCKTSIGNTRSLRRAEVASPMRRRPPQHIAKNPSFTEPAPINSDSEDREEDRRWHGHVMRARLQKKARSHAPWRPRRCAGLALATALIVSASCQ